MNNIVVMFRSVDRGKELQMTKASLTLKIDIFYSRGEFAGHDVCGGDDIRPEGSRRYSDDQLTHSKKTRLLPADQVRLPCSKPEKMVVTANNDSDYYKV